jgi:hypothetical protein
MYNCPEQLYNWICEWLSLIKQILHSKFVVHLIESKHIRVCNRASSGVLEVLQKKQFFPFSLGVLQYFTQTGKITPLDVFSDAFPVRKMQKINTTSPSKLVIWVVTHP